MLERFIDMEHSRLGPALVWAIAAAAILSVFAVVSIIVNFAPLNSDAEQRVETQLPPATYETVAALVKATGAACHRICAITAINSLTQTHAVEVECAADDSTTSCRTPIRYRINVESATDPQR